MSVENRLEEIIKLQGGYSEFVNENEQVLLDGFCDKIKEEKIGDLTLEDYTRFLFWKKTSNDDLRSFHIQFKNDTKDGEISFDAFCEYIWIKMIEDDDDMPDELKEVRRILETDIKGIA